MKLDTECIGNFSFSLFYLPLQAFLSLQCSQKFASMWRSEWSFLEKVCLATASVTIEGPQEHLGKHEEWKYPIRAVTHSGLTKGLEEE